MRPRCPLPPLPLLPLLRLLPLLALPPHYSQAQGLSDIERRIISAVDAHAPEATALLERAVNLNSGSMNPAGVRAVGDLYRAELDTLGFSTRLIPMDAVQRGPHLFAERVGEGPRVLLIGHLDTVFEPDSPFQRFRRLDDSTAAGPGTEDMKGGNGVVILALQALRDAGVLDRMNLIVAFTGDEEDTGDPLEVSRGDLVEAAKRSAYALGFEGGVGGRGTATVARRGFTGWKLAVHATPAHSSLVFRPQYGYGAIFELARILDAFRAELAGEEYLTFNPGVALGGTTVHFDPTQGRGDAFGKTNVIAETAVAAGDLRTVSVAQLERAKERMRAIVARSLPGTSAVIDFEDSSPPMDPKPANHALLERLNRVSLDLGMGAVEAVDPSQRGAADISFVNAHVGAALDGLGVVGDGGHTVEERVDLRTIPFMAKRAAVLIYRLTREGMAP
jgi:glutamate carboxypeptidase